MLARFLPHCDVLAGQVLQLPVKGGTWKCGIIRGEDDGRGESGIRLGFPKTHTVARPPPIIGQLPQIDESPFVADMKDI